VVEPESRTANGAASARRALAYCAFQHRDGIVPPRTGVNGALVQAVANDRLRVLWSNVEWPFAPTDMQRHAVEFHRVVNQVFAATAVAPFPLLTIFPDSLSLQAFIAARAATLLADLDRLRDLVQMECVLYVISERSRSALSGEMREALAHSARQVQEAIPAIGAETRIREVKSGLRIFTLVQRGVEREFKSLVERVALPERIFRRTSGPRPAAEFLTQPLKPALLASDE
jgi:gas vesicle protein GvpL/GvpF